MSKKLGQSSGLASLLKDGYKHMSGGFLLAEPVGLLLIYFRGRGGRRRGTRTAQHIASSARRWFMFSHLRPPFACRFG